MKKMLPSILLLISGGFVLVFGALYAERHDWAHFGICLTAALVLLVSCLLEANYLRLARKIDELSQLVQEEARNKGNLKSKVEDQPRNKNS